MTGRVWLNTAQAGDHAGCSPTTVLRALEAGELHGTQRKAKGRWRINIACLDAWCAGDKCGH